MVALNTTLPDEAATLALLVPVAWLVGGLLTMGLMALVAGPGSASVALLAGALGNLLHLI